MLDLCIWQGRQPVQGLLLFGQLFFQAVADELCGCFPMDGDAQYLDTGLAGVWCEGGKAQGGVQGDVFRPLRGGSDPGSPDRGLFPVDEAPNACKRGLEGHEGVV